MKAFWSSVIGGAALVLASAALARDAAAPVPDDVPIALLVDLSSGQTLFSRNPDRRFVPASITKAMTAYTAFDLIKRGELREDQRFSFNEAAAKEWQRTGSTMFLEAGDETSVADLLKAITTVSANDGSIVLAEGAAGSVDAWVKRMNANAGVLNMRQSHFGTPNGFPDGGRTFTTARDLTKLGRAIVQEHPTLYARYFGHRGLVTGGIAQDNHDPITGRVPGADGIKTGYTNQAGFGFLGSAERNGRRLMMVVAGVSEESSRDRTARDLINWGFDAFTSRALFAAGEAVGQARVQDGAAREVGLLAESPISYVTPSESDAGLTLAIRYEGPLRAPITAGERVAQLEISIEGMPPSYVPLVAAADVPQAGPFQRILNAFTGLFA